MANLRVSDSLFRRRWEKEKNILCKELTPEAVEKLAKKRNNEDATHAVLISQITEDASLP